VASATFDLVKQLAYSLSDAEKAQLLAQLAPKQEEAAPSSSPIAAPDNQFLAALAAMAAAAETPSEDAYLAAYGTVDWDQADAGTFEAAIHLAFTAGAHMAARLLATKGAALHPDSEYLRYMAYVLAPPTVIGHRPASNHVNAANKRWLNENRALYRGQWVALRGGELLGSGSTLSELVNRFGAVPEILYTRVT